MPLLALPLHMWVLVAPVIVTLRLTWLLTRATVRCLAWGICLAVRCATALCRHAIIPVIVRMRG